MSQIKKVLILMKLDFKKAFDKVEHNVIFEVMRYKGFPVRWIKGIMSSCTSLVLFFQDRASHISH
jgi:hypothetical protein